MGCCRTPLQSLYKTADNIPKTMPMVIEPKNSKRNYKIGSNALFYLATDALAEAATRNKAIETASFSIDYPSTII